MLDVHEVLIWYMVSGLVAIGAAVNAALPFGKELDGYHEQLRTARTFLLLSASVLLNVGADASWIAYSYPADGWIQKWAHVIYVASFSIGLVGTVVWMLVVNRIQPRS